MYILVVNLFLQSGVFLCANPGETLAVDETFQRVDRGDQDVYSQVEFVAGEEERVVEVFLHYYWLAEYDLL